MEKKREQTGIYPSPESRDVVEKKRAERVLAHPPGSDRNPNAGGTGMAVDSQYNDSEQADNPEQSGNWKSIGELASDMVDEMPDPTSERCKMVFTFTRARYLNLTTRDLELIAALSFVSTLDDVCYILDAVEAMR